MERRRRVVWTLAALALLAGCGGGSAGADHGPLATLDVFSRAVAVRTAEAFRPATDGQDLAVGDRVRTDEHGFAEVTFFEGSWMRVESGATLTVRALADSAKGQSVRTSIDIGRSWQRVERLTEPEDEFEVETPVASAAVRGTAFAIDCHTRRECAFAVVEGVVELTLDDGTTVTLRAGQRLTVREDEPPAEPEDVGDALRRTDPWMVANLALDQSRGRPDLAAAGLAGDYALTRTVEIGNPNFPVGQVDRATTTMKCTGSPCRLDIEDWSNLQVVGDVIRSSGSYTEPCQPESGTGTVGSDFAIVLRATAFEVIGGRRVPTRFEGSQVIAANRIPPTCATRNAPVTFSLVLERKPPAPEGGVESAPSVS